MTRRHKSSSLFLLRVWPEEASGGHTRWCGNVRQVVSGEAHSFCDLATLTTTLLDMLPDHDENPPPPPALADHRGASGGNGQTPAS